MLKLFFPIDYIKFFCYLSPNGDNIKKSITTLSDCDAFVYVGMGAAYINLL